MTFNMLWSNWTNDLSPRTLPLLLDATIKGTALLALAGAAMLPMRRASASTRQLLLLLALVSLLILPLISLATPGWRVLPGWANADVARHTAAPAPSAVPPEPVPQSFKYPAIVPSDLAQKSHGQLISVRLPAPVSPSPKLNLAQWAMTIWATGVLFFLMRLIIGRVSIALLQLRSERIRDGALLDLTAKAGAHLGLRSSVALFLSSRRSMPMMWGILRPAILLPDQAAHWTPDRLWVVLLHELAHVRRQDMLGKLLGNLACCLYWFNPLCWVTFKLMQREAEAACDDLVLAGCPKPGDYAMHLLEIASGFRSNLLAAPTSIAMARKGELEGRLRAIIDPRRDRRAMARGRVLLSAMLVFAIVLPLAIVRAKNQPEPSPDTRPASSQPANGVAKPPVEDNKPIVLEGDAAKGLMHQADLLARHILAGDADYVRATLKTSPDLATVRDSAHLTSMNEAIQSANLSMIQVLVDSGVKVNPGGYNETPLGLAVRLGLPAVAELLIKDGADINPANKFHTPILLDAINNDQPAMVKLLLDHHVDVESGNSANLPLSLAANQGYTDIAKMLLDAGAKVDARLEGDGQTALIRAANNDRVEVVQLLLANHADPKIADKKGQTAMDRAIFNGRRDLLDILDAAGVSGGFWEQVARGDVAGVNSALDQQPTLINTAGAGGFTPLHLASAYGGPEIVQVLLSRGADISARNDDGKTPLHLAVVRGRVEVVELLIKNKADVNAVDKTGRTPMHDCTWRTDMVRVLLEAGASPDIPDKQGQKVRNQATPAPAGSELDRLLSQYPPKAKPGTP